MKVLWLSDADAASMVSMPAALSLVEQAFRSLAEGKAQMPPKLYLDFPEHGGDLRVMPAYLPSPDGSFAGVKVVNSHAKNPARGLPAVAAVLVLNDPETGMPLSVMAAGTLTAMRTGAAGALAARLMARPDSRVVGLIGCGRQAATQWEGLKDLFDIREVRVAGATLKEAEDFCQRLRPSSKAEFIPCLDVKSACEADILVTTTPSHKPVVKSEWVRPGTHINAIGADAPGKQELESVLTARARVVVDLKEQAFHSGEVNVPLSEKTLKPEQVVGEMGDIVSGRKKARTSPDDITIFDSTGLAVQDIALAGWLYRRAKELNKGSWMEM